MYKRYVYGKEKKEPHYFNPINNYKQVYNHFKENFKGWDIQNYKNQRKRDNMDNKVNSVEDEINETKGPAIEDVISGVTQNSMDLLKGYYEREDDIRKRVESREDNAYQRAVQDMRKAGINPNLTGIQRAESGGGLTNATKAEEMGNTILGMYSEKELTQMKLEVEKEIEKLRADTTKNENEKSRQIGWLEAISKLIGSIIPM